MANFAVEATQERIQKRWVIGAFLLALLLHFLAAYFFGHWRIPQLATPANPMQHASPFQLKRIQIRPEALAPVPPDPIQHLPQAEPPKNPSQFQLDPRQIDRALQTPQPTIAYAVLPDPTRVVASTPMQEGQPFAASDTAKLEAEISKFHTGPASSGSVTPGQLADNLLTAQAGPLQAGPSSAIAGSGQGTAQLPGFSDLAPKFQLPPPNLRNLPDPVLVRLPADVLFDFNSAVLKPEADPLLSQGADLIKKYPQANVQVDGYSDAIGDTGYNQTLSEQRAQAVVTWLQAHVPPGSYNFTAQGHGASNFVVDPKGTIQQQQQNRRVELLIQALKMP